MKNRRITFAGLASVALLATSVSAYAFPPGGGPCGYGGGPGMMQWGGGPGMMGYGRGFGPRGGWGPGAGANAVSNVEGRLAFLKSELKITGNQEAAWNAYAAQAKHQAETMQAFFAQRATPAQSAPDRIAQRAEFAKQRAAAVESMSDSLKDLYAALTPEQKTLADQYFGGGMFFAQRGPRGYGPRW